MNPEKFAISKKNMKNQYFKFEKELDRIVSSQINIRIDARKKKKDLNRITDEIESRNRHIVKAHQNNETPKILGPMFATFLQMQEGGKLYIPETNRDEEKFKIYFNTKGRYETLFAAAIMALEDRELARIINLKRELFRQKHKDLKEGLLLMETVIAIGKEAEKKIEWNPAKENEAVLCLDELAPFKSDLKAIETKCAEYIKDGYLTGLGRMLQRSIQNAENSIALKSRKAAKFLFSQASGVFHMYKSTPVDIVHYERFMAQKEELAQYEKIFSNIGDKDRQEKIENFIKSIDNTLSKLNKKIEKQKNIENLAAEKKQGEIHDAFDQFLEIKNMYADSQITTHSQKKNIGIKLKKIRDTLIANGQRVMAMEVERFMNSTGTGISPKKKSFLNPDDNQEFDYRKGFFILLPITIILLFILFLLIAR